MTEVAEIIPPKLFAESLDLNVIFRVKGKSDLYIPIGPPNKSGLIPMTEFFGLKRATVKVKDITRLGDYEFFTTDNVGRISLKEVFNNLSSHQGDLNALTIPEFMDIMVPNYDKEQFKSYHAELVLKWFVELTMKINNNSI